MTTITYDQFVEQVQSVFPDADDRGIFRNHVDKEFAESYPDRKYYTWQDGFYCASYDTMIWESFPDKRWLVQTGGSTGYGNTIEEAVKDAYDSAFS